MFCKHQIFFDDALGCSVELSRLHQYLKVKKMSIFMNKKARDGKLIEGANELLLPLGRKI